MDSACWKHAERHREAYKQLQCSPRTVGKFASRVAERKTIKQYLSEVPPLPSGASDPTEAFSVQSMAGT